VTFHEHLLLMDKVRHRSRMTSVISRIAAVTICAMAEAVV